MIPISDNIPSLRLPVITRLIILANVLIFLQELGLDERHLQRFLFYYGIVPARYTNPDIAAIFSLPQQIFPFVSSVFLHGGWLHLLGNMITLWIFGDNVEDRMGRLPFLVFYLAMGVAAGAAEVVAGPASTTPIIGASGAIAGVMGAYFVLFPHARVVLAVPIFFFIDFWEVPAPVFFSFWFIIQFFNGALGLLSSQGAFGGIAWWAHIGGFAGGMLVGLIFRLVSGKSRRLPPYEEEYK